MLGSHEIELLTRVIEIGTLFAPKGHYVKILEREFADWVGSTEALACSSGTAAIHSAVACIDPEPGEEIITTPVTDIGALTPILYQGAIPVFADVDPNTGNLTPESISERISDRTRAVVVTHLFGNPVDVHSVQRAIGSIPIIEDCAQAFGASVRGSRVGSLGDIGTFSLQQGKHITTGEGGLIVTSDAEMAEHMRLYINKAWDYENPSDHEFLALNYRMSELQGAVGVAQLAKLEDGVTTRRSNARRLTEALQRIPGITPVASGNGLEPSYWRYSLLVDAEVVPGGPDGLAEKLRDIGIPAAPRYIKKPAFRTGLFASQRTFGSSRWPFTTARIGALDYSEHSYPGTFDFLSRVLVLPWNERFGPSDVDRIASAVSDGVSDLIGEAA